MYYLFVAVVSLHKTTDIGCLKIRECVNVSKICNILDHVQGCFLCEAEYCIEGFLLKVLLFTLTVVLI